jgi:hypothetical protein
MKHKAKRFSESISNLLLSHIEGIGLIAAVVVHGGAINPSFEEYTEGVGDSIIAGSSIFIEVGRPLTPRMKLSKRARRSTFGAGAGSWPKLYGDVEMDVIITDGKTLKAGAVASSTRAAWDWFNRAADETCYPAFAKSSIQIYFLGKLITNLSAVNVVAGDSSCTVNAEE